MEDCGRREYFMVRLRQYLLLVFVMTIKFLGLGLEVLVSPLIGIVIIIIIIIIVVVAVIIIMKNCSIYLRTHRV